MRDTLIAYRDTVGARLLALSGSAAVVACAAMAAGGLNMPFAVVVLIAAAASVWFPDTHLGTGVVLAMGLGWLVVVDEVTSPWSVGAGAGVALFHVGLAAASVAPPGAAWPMAMRRRWFARTAVVVSACALAHLSVRVIRALSPQSSALLVTVSLFVLAAAATWAASVHPH